MPAKGEAIFALTLRKGASASDESVGKLSKGAVVTVNGRSKDKSGNEWYLVKTGDNQTGYVLSDGIVFIRVIDETNKPADDDLDIEFPVKGEVKYQLTMSIGASVSSEAVGKIQKGSIVTVHWISKDKAGNNWYLVEQRIIKKAMY